VSFRRLFGRPEGAPRQVQCVRATPADRAAALSSVFGANVASAPTFERRAAENGVDLSHLWIASVEGTMIGAAILVPHPGRTALLMASGPRDHAHAAELGQLIAAILAERSSTPDVRLVQALSSPGETLRSTAWVAGGMRHLASLDYMERAIAGAPVPHAPMADGVELAAWDPSERGMLESLLLETYVETLDCPGLAQMRTPADIVDGHLAAGEHDPSLWTIARLHGRPVGALLLSPSPATDSVEVIYLGIAAEARGRGLGRALIAHGLRLVADRPERMMALAVDARNTPATALYARTGFRTLRRREAFVAHLDA
jgi:ribosomal protein S18 acetylase RimI-like enzyme